MAERDEGIEGFLDDGGRGVDGGGATGAVDHQREAWHFSPQLGDDPLARRRPDAGESGERFRVLFLDQHREFFDRPDHRPQRLSDAHPVDAAEQIEELAFGFGHEADQPWREPAALCGVAFDVVDRVESNRLVDFGLELSPGVIADQDFVFERDGFQDRGRFADAEQAAGNRDDQGVRLTARGESYEALSQKVVFRSVKATLSGTFADPKATMNPFETKPRAGAGSG